MSEQNGERDVDYCGHCYGPIGEARKASDARIAALEAEVAEQCRLNGMGSEREARLMAQLAEARNDNAEIITTYETKLAAAVRRAEDAERAGGVLYTAAESALRRMHMVGVVDLLQITWYWTDEVAAAIERARNPSTRTVVEDAINQSKDHDAKWKERARGGGNG